MGYCTTLIADFVAAPYLHVIGTVLTLQLPDLYIFRSFVLQIVGGFIVHLIGSLLLSDLAKW